MSRHVGGRHVGSSAPGWMHWLLRRTGGARGDELVGDLEETHRARLEQRGRAVAHVLTALKTADVAFAVLRERTRRRKQDHKRTLGLSTLDVKLGVRMLAKYRGLSVVSVIGMSVAIAIGAGFFQFIDSMLDPALPLAQHERIMSLDNRNTKWNDPERRSLADFVKWRSELKSVQELSAFTNVNRNLMTPSGAVHFVDVAEITASGLRVPRVMPLLGRLLLDEDERPGAPAVIVIAHDEWQHRFAGDRNIVGRQVRLGSEIRTVIGVMPEGFRFPIDHRYWIPLQTKRIPQSVGEGPAIYMFGRLAAGATLQTAQAELATIGQRMASTYPKTHEFLRPAVMPYTYSFWDVESPGMVRWCVSFSSV